MAPKKGRAAEGQGQEDSSNPTHVTGTCSDSVVCVVYRVSCMACAVCAARACATLRHGKRSHARQVSSTYGPDFWSLVGEHKCSDIEFEVAGDIVPAHSVVLIAHSPRFMKVRTVARSAPTPPPLSSKKPRATMRRMRTCDVVSYSPSPRVQSFIREGRRRKAVLGVDEETFRAVLDWIYAGIFPKPESTGTHSTLDTRHAHHRMHTLAYGTRATHELTGRASIRYEGVHQVVQRGRQAGRG
jgi:hypothetical protein